MFDKNLNSIGGNLGTKPSLVSQEHKNYIKLAQEL